MTTQQDTDHLTEVRWKTESILRRHSGLEQDVALLDAPALINVGDSMIWQGQVEYMNRLGHRIRYAADMQSYDARRLKRSMPDGGIVMLRGGGNFGDLWVGHQNFRERVAQELRNCEIVQLTQSVMFRDPARAAQANKVLSAHPSFTLLVRDDLSMERAREQLPDVKIERAYDMALGWTPRRTAEPTPGRVVVIARRDREASSGLAEASEAWRTPYDVHVTDWGSHARYPSRWGATRKLLKQNGKLVYRQWPSLPQPTIERSLRYLNRWNLDSAVDLFSQAQAMVVDRLHAHVIASLLGIPHVVLDNDHGKISSVFHSYTGQFSTAHYTTSTDEARAILDELMSR
ncbi:polysaccharide pyruvyl transferase family protein [Microbacterium jejuense]|uniref:Polysaccharide pyruvyl transferase family protein n=1 Tax=Microbacterium jejuense TaxID=1263637 RepID=A0ABS7HJG1_9MICO|nr:polysaccharide pyruvyl transferase family protein [Microbacterium jejuense]MBW9093092.1 polysaccharide pyruvyl transferase family protein [Microbacterium jejuense]